MADDRACPECGRPVPVDPDGDLAWHRVGPTRDEPMCPGSFRPPEPEDDPE